MVRALTAMQASSLLKAMTSALPRMPCASSCPSTSTPASPLAHVPRVRGHPCCSSVMKAGWCGWRLEASDAHLERAQAGAGYGFSLCVLPHVEGLSRGALEELHRVDRCLQLLPQPLPLPAPIQSQDTDVSEASSRAHQQLKTRQAGLRQTTCCLPSSSAIAAQPPLAALLSSCGS